MKKNFYLFLKLLFVFAILFDINFKFLPSLTTSRIALIALSLIAFVRKDKVSSFGVCYLFILLSILTFSIFQFFYSGDFTQCSRIIWFSLYSIVVPFLFKNYIKNRNEFFCLIAVAVLIQAILTISSYLIPSVKAIFSNLIIYSSNFDETNLLRAMGFASVGGASFSVIQSAGIISLLVLNKLNVLSFFNRILLWVSILLIFISIFFIGRTGLFIGIIATLIYLVSLRFKLKNIIIFVIFLFLAFQINYIKLIDNLTSDVEGFRSDLFITWIESSFELKGNETTEALNEMPVPPLSFETIIGTGRVRDLSGLENASGHDSGYIQTYYSLGLLLAIFFYFTFFLFLLYQIRLEKKYNAENMNVLYLLVLVISVIELKEPFIFNYSYPFFVLSSILIFSKQDLNFKLIKT